MKRKVKMDEQSIVVIASYGEPIEANLAKLKLEAEGIEAVLHDENTVAMQPFYSNLAGGVKLLVRKNRAEKACEILGEKNIATAKAEIRCPECGSDDYSVFSLSNIMWVLAGLITLGLGRRTKYKCNACGNNW